MTSENSYGLDLILVTDGQMVVVVVGVCVCVCVLVCVHESSWEHEVKPVSNRLLHGTPSRHLFDQPTPTPNHPFLPLLP